MGAPLPFLTLPDPLVSGEGALDPLGLAMIGDRLADQILPGLRARMSRPRFLTAIAVAAAVCEGVEDRFASDGVTPAYLVFEWLMVEAFVRAGKRELMLRTPGIQKAQDVRDSGEVMCAKTYLRTPAVFGFHGVYKPLARALGIVDDDFRLGDTGYELLKTWQVEQGLGGFIESSVGDGPGRSVRQTLRSAVDEGLSAGFTKRSGSWQGWSLLAGHLAPAVIGSKEAAFIYQLLSDVQAIPRGEIFELLRNAVLPDHASEQQIAHMLLLPKAAKVLSARLNAITAYERMCGALEEAFDWARHLSTHSRERPITAASVTQEARVRQLASDLGAYIKAAEHALADSPLPAQELFAQLAQCFDQIRDAGSLFEAVLLRHAAVQRAKPPEGKRPWFERAPDGATFVRVPYRLIDQPASAAGWNRPYRISTVLSFLDDLKAASHEPA